MEKQEGRRDRKKLFTYIALFIIFQTIVVVAFSQTVMKIRNPKVRLGAVVVQSINTGATSSSFNIRLITEITIKNTNFGHFRYDSTPLNILYSGIIVGQTVIPKDRADARKTKRFALYVDISSDAISGFPNFNNDVNSGVLFLTSQARVSGKVRVMILNKKKSPELSCALAINLATRQILDVTCQ